MFHRQWIRLLGFCYLATLTHKQLEGARRQHKIQPAPWSISAQSLGLEFSNPHSSHGYLVESLRTSRLYIREFSASTFTAAASTCFPSHCWLLLYSPPGYKISQQFQRHTRQLLIILCCDPIKSPSILYIFSYLTDKSM